MLKVDFEFYKGILFVRLKGILTKYSLMIIYFSSLIDYIGFKYIVFNINNIRLIDAYAIDYLVNYNRSLNSHNKKAFVCLDTSSFISKFSNKIQIINKEKEVLNKI